MATQVFNLKGDGTRRASLYLNSCFVLDIRTFYINTYRVIQCQVSILYIIPFTFSLFLQKKLGWEAHIAIVTNIKLNFAVWQHKWVHKKNTAWKHLVVSRKGPRAGYVLSLMLPRGCCKLTCKASSFFLWVSVLYITRWFIKPQCSMDLDVSRSTFARPEAQRVGTLWRGLKPTQNVTLSTLSNRFLMADIIPINMIIIIKLFLAS